MLRSLLPSISFCGGVARQHAVQFLSRQHSTASTNAHYAEWGKGSSICQPWSFALLAVPAFASCEALNTTDASDSGFSGIWIRDTQATDMNAYSKQLEVMQISGVKKQTALNFIEGLQLEERDDSVTIQFLTSVPFFKVTEEVKIGATVDQPRRDKRKGVQKATATRHKTGMTVKMTWDEPLAGCLIENYSFSASTLTVESAVTVHGQSASARLVYKRNDKWRPKLSL